MKQLSNTLFVTTPDTYLALDGENVVILKKMWSFGGFPSIIWRVSSPSATQAQALR